MYFIIKYLVFFLAFIAGADANVNSWMVYSSNGVPPVKEDVLLPIEGKSVVAINPVLKEFNENVKSRDVDDSYYGYLDFYYFSQTINCRDFKGKHFHISNYAKLDQTNVIAHYESYKRLRVQEIIAYYENNDLELDVAKLKNNSKNWKNEYLLRNTDVDLTVFISSDNSLKTIAGTNNFSTTSPEWQRLNIEVDVPDNCNAITVSIKFRGVGNLYLDDFVVIERGSNTNQRNINSRHRKRGLKLEEMIDSWVSRSKNKFKFENMGFEESNLIR